MSEQSAPTVGIALAAGAAAFFVVAVWTQVDTQYTLPAALMLCVLFVAAVLEA
jgi:hypothetical protein